MAEEFWNKDNPDKPWAKFDINATLDITFDWSEWLAEIGESHDSHQIFVESPLEVVTSFHTLGKIVVFIRVETGGEVTQNRKYTVTCRITTTGATPRVDERTVYLKMMHR